MQPMKKSGKHWWSLGALDGDVKRMLEQLDTMVEKKGVSLSGGQKQRLSIKLST